MSIFIQFKRFFGPIRNFKEKSPNKFLYVIETPGLTKDLLQVEITHNGLVMMDGHIIIKEYGFTIYKKSIHEAILLPTNVNIGSIKWDIQNGITTVTCNTNNK